VTLPLKISGFVTATPVATVTRLEGELNASNTATATKPQTVKPTTTEWKHGLRDAQASVTLPAYSFTVLRF